MIYRIFPTKDTFITNAQRNSAQQTGSNFGASEILDLFKKAGVSGSTSLIGSASYSRVLMQFDLSEIAALTASGKAPATGSQYFLRLSNARHADTLPTSYDIQIVPMSRSWDEGVGIDNDTYLDKGHANWDKATQSTLWTTPGGDFVTSSLVTYHFDNGQEDVEVDISTIVGAWLTGTLVNNGLMVKLTAGEEIDSSDYYIKKFHARNSSFKDERPVIEMRWDDSKRDDRDNFVYGVSNNLFLYNKVKGALTNISGLTGQNVLSVRIIDASGTIANGSGSHVGLTGIYSASFTINSASYSGSVFHDIWYSGSTAYMTGTFYPRRDDAYESNEQKQYVVSVKDLRKEYSKDQLVRFNMFVRTRDYNPAFVLTASMVMGNTVITKGYYKVVNASTNKQLIMFGTGSVETSRLSYDKNGNYFELYMSSLPENEVYKLVFLFDVDGQRQVLDEEIKFRVIA